MGWIKSEIVVFGFAKWEKYILDGGRESRRAWEEKV